MTLKQIIPSNTKNDLYLEPLNFDFYKNSCLIDRYVLQKAINNIIEVLNKITERM